MKNQAFTLIELLVVVLIIGILAAIAVPQYQKAVLKADLHRGVSLVESLYQAQQSYYLQHGDYAWDLDELDVSIPKDASCIKDGTGPNQSIYDCDYGRIWNDKRNAVQFQNKPQKSSNSRGDLAYSHYFKTDGIRKAGERWCFANPKNQIAQEVCQSIGGVYSDGDVNSSWIRYKIN